MQDSRRFQAGQWVRVARPTTLSGQDQELGRVAQGTIVQVKEVNGEQVWVELEGKKGWLPAADLQLPQLRQPGILEFDVGIALDWAGGLTRSRSGEHFAYVAAAPDGDVCVVLDGQPGAKHEAIRDDTLVFSADGRRFAYVAKEGEKSFVVLDGQPGPKCDWIVWRDLVARADGAFAYYAVANGRFRHVLHFPHETPRAK